MYDFPNAKSLVVSGDIHGDFTQLVYKCCIQYGMTDTVIIVAGDCGFGFEEPGFEGGETLVPVVILGQQPLVGMYRFFSFHCSVCFNLFIL